MTSIIIITFVPVIFVVADFVTVTDTVLFSIILVVVLLQLFF